MKYGCLCLYYILFKQCQSLSWCVNVNICRRICVCCVFQSLECNAPCACVREKRSERYSHCDDDDDAGNRLDQCLPACNGIVKWNSDKSEYPFYLYFCRGTFTMCFESIKIWIKYLEVPVCVRLGSSESAREYLAFGPLSFSRWHAYNSQPQTNQARTFQSTSMQRIHTLTLSLAVLFRSVLFKCSWRWTLLLPSLLNAAASIVAASIVECMKLFTI